MCPGLEKSISHLYAHSPLRELHWQSCLPQLSLMPRRTACAARVLSPAPLRPSPLTALYCAATCTAKGCPMTVCTLKTVAQICLLTDLAGLSATRGSQHRQSFQCGHGAKRGGEIEFRGDNSEILCSPFVKMVAIRPLMDKARIPPSPSQRATWVMV